MAVVGLTASSADPDTTGSAVPLHTGDKVWMAGYDAPGTITGTGRSMSLPDGTHIHHAFEVEFDTDKVKEGQALIDHDGKVVGLCTRDASGDVVGIPIDLARSAATSLRTHKKLVLPYLGVTGGDQGPNARAGVPDGGALITSVNPGGPAQQAGVEPGDVVVAFGDDKIGSISALRAGRPRPRDRRCGRGAGRPGRQDPDVHVDPRGKTVLTR